VMIESLPPDQQAQQDAWAFQQLPNFDFCPAGLDWSRVEHGYRCTGGYHFVTHELLAQETPGYYDRLHRMVVKTRGLPRFGHLDDGCKKAFSSNNLGGGNRPLPQPQQGRFLIPADGYWWIGPRYTAPRGGFGLVKPRGIQAIRASPRGRSGPSLNEERLPPGPGDPLPTPQDFGYSSWQHANISFPKGMLCRPG